MISIWGGEICGNPVEILVVRLLLNKVQAEEMVQPQMVAFPGARRWQNHNRVQRVA